MTRTAVSSTNLAFVEYDPKFKKLKIWFKNGGIYAYGGVPENIFTDFMDASSKGTFFKSFIDRKFPTQKIS
jgi:hypothetical protein